MFILNELWVLIRGNYHRLSVSSTRYNLSRLQRMPLASLLQLRISHHQWLELNKQGYLITCWCIGHYRSLDHHQLMRLFITGTGRTLTKNLRISIFGSKASALCQSVDLIDTASSLAELYHSVITRWLDELAPITKTTICTRTKCPFFNEECRLARRHAHRLERVY